MIHKNQLNQVQDKDFLLGRCDGCLAENAIYNPRREYHECPKCGQIYDMYDLAREHLEHLLTQTPLLTTWLEHYKERGLGELASRDILMDVVREAYSKVWVDAPVIKDWIEASGAI